MSKFRLDYPLYEEAPLLQGFAENSAIYRQAGLSGHNGLDLGVYPGTHVLAMASGTILFAGDGFHYPIMGAAAGNCVVIDHGDYWTGYAHLLTAYGEEGYEVKAGEIIGISGATGATSGAHLHIEVIEIPLRLDSGYMGRISPLQFFKRGTPLYTPPLKLNTPLPVEEGTPHE